MELGAVIDSLYASEINCSVSTFWDGCITVRLGDETNGFVAETDCKTSAEAAQFLDTEARHHFPDSSYALRAECWMILYGAGAISTSGMPSGRQCAIGEMRLKAASRS